MIAYLRLIRLPNLFTAVADPLTGALLAASWLARHGFAGGVPRGGEVGLLCLASACLAAAGFALNDLCDQKEDARRRPWRPIPSGQVPVLAALALAAALTAGGLAAAWPVGHHALIIAVALAATICFYDGLAKRIRGAGPVVMGLCRVLNLALGLQFALSAAADVSRLADPLAHPYLDLLWPLLSCWVYVAAVTYVAQYEEGGAARDLVVAGTLLMLAAPVAGGVLYAPPEPFCLLPWGILGIWLVVRAVPAARTGRPEDLKRLVQAGVFGILLFDAGWVLAAGARYWPFALLLSALYIPTFSLAKLLRQTEA